MVNIILAGYDKETGPSLYYIDYIATLHKVDKAAFGYGSYFSLAMIWLGIWLVLSPCGGQPGSLVVELVETVFASTFLPLSIIWFSPNQTSLLCV